MPEHVAERDGSGKRTKLTAQISLKGDILLKLCNKLYLAHVKNEL